MYHLHCLAPVRRNRQLANSKTTSSNKAGFALGWFPSNIVEHHDVGRDSGWESKCLRNSTFEYFSSRISVGNSFQTKGTPIARKIGTHWHHQLCAALQRESPCITPRPQLVWSGATPLRIQFVLRRVLTLVYLCQNIPKPQTWRKVTMFTSDTNACVCPQSSRKHIPLDAPPHQNVSS